MDIVSELTEPVKRRWWWGRQFLVISVVVHLLFALGAGFFVVSRYANRRKLTFNAGPKSPNPSERALQHKVQMQQKTKSAPQSVPKRVLTTGASKVALPEMPSMPGPKTATQPAMMAAAGGGMGGTGGVAGSAGGTGTGSQINFFGIRDTATSVVVMIDVSDSMFTRTGDAQERELVKQGKEQSFQRIRDEAITLIESLTPVTRFGIVRWSGGAYSWRPELVLATDENKQAAIQHIQTEVDMKKARPKGGRPGGTRHDYALEEAFALKPETIYMLTDGNATIAGEGGGGMKPIPAEDIYRVTDEGQKTLAKKAKLHTIYYVNAADKEEERQMLMRLALRNGGQFRKVEAPNRKEAEKARQEQKKDSKRDKKKDKR